MKIDNILNTLSFNGIQTKKVVSNSSGNVILISIERGKELTAHKSNTDASILVLEGDVIFKMNSQEYSMKENDLFSFKKDEIHAVEAISNAKLILIK